MTEKVETTKPKTKATTTTPKIYRSLLGVQKSIKDIKKSGESSFFNGKTATYEDVYSHTINALNENNLIIFHSITDDKLTTSLLNIEDGSSIESVLDIVGFISGKKATEVGALITYAKKYSFLGLLGIATSENEDEKLLEIEKKQNEEKEKKQKVEQQRNFVAQLRDKYNEMPEDKFLKNYETIKNNIDKKGISKEQVIFLLNIVDVRYDSLMLKQTNQESQENKMKEENEDVNENQEVKVEAKDEENENEEVKVEEDKGDIVF